MPELEGRVLCGKFVLRGLDRIRRSWRIVPPSVWLLEMVKFAVSLWRDWRRFERECEVYGFEEDEW